MDLENNAAQPRTFKDFFQANRRTFAAISAALLVVVVVAVAVAASSGSSSGSSPSSPTPVDGESTSNGDNNSQGGSTEGDGNQGGSDGNGAGPGDDVPTTPLSTQAPDDTTEYQGGVDTVTVTGTCDEDSNGNAVLSGLSSEVGCLLSPSFHRALVTDGSATFEVPLDFAEVDMYSFAEGSNDCSDFVGVFSCAA